MLYQIWNFDEYTVLLYAGAIETHLITDILDEGFTLGFFIENLSMNVEFLDKRTRDNCRSIVSDFQQVRSGALLIINDYIPDLLWGNQFIFLLYRYGKDKIER